MATKKPAAKRAAFSRMIFVNLAVRDLERSKKFFSALGFSFNRQFSNKDGACLVISDTIYAMLLVPRFFKSFTPKKLVDSRNSVEAMLALNAESRAEVDRLVGKALGHGGKAHGTTQELGFMYARDFEDPDGHVWSVFWMDPKHVK